jgi:hypothetical protein
VAAYAIFWLRRRLFRTWGSTARTLLRFVRALPQSKFMLPGESSFVVLRSGPREHFRLDDPFVTVFEALVPLRSMPSQPESALHP